MYPNSPHVDEPTMTDLRGVLPAQRPPVDARVLDEPTSEVPIIRPAGTVDADPEPAPAPVTEPATDAGYVEEAESVDAMVEVEEPAEVPAEVEEADEAEPTAEASDVEAAATTESAAAVVETEPDAEPIAPEPAFTPPVVPAFGTDVTAASHASELAKMAWSPAPPPGLVPASTTSPFETTPRATEPVGLEPVAELTEVTELTEPAVAEPETVEPEAVELEPAELQPAELEPAELEVTAPEVVEPAAGTSEPDAEVEPEQDIEAVAEPSEPEALAVEPAAQPAPEPEPTAVDEPAPVVHSRAPGEVSETPIALWSDEATQRLRDQWRELQVQFIDDPNAAVTGAKGLVTDAVHDLADTLLAAQAELDPFRGGDRVDTEAMRVAMRRYREFLDRVLAL